MKNLSKFQGVAELKKILLISTAFHPEISPRSNRATELAKELSRSGHMVHVLTRYRDFDYNNLALMWRIKITQLSRTRLPIIGIEGGWLIGRLKRVIRRILLMLFEYPEIEFLFKVAKALKSEDGYDLLISNAAPYPVHWGVAKVRNKTRRIATTWVADCGDPFMGNRVDTFRKFFYFRYVEKWFCKKTDYISVPIETARKAFYPDFREKIVVIPQGVNFSSLKRATYQKEEDIVRFAFSGAIISYKDTAPGFFDFLVSSNFPFRFVMYTQELGWSGEYIQKLGDRIELHSYVPREQLIYELSKVDFLINFQIKINVQRSSKLIDYALTGRPILNIEYGKNFEAQFKEFMKGDYTQKYKINDLEQYNIKNIANSFIELVQN